jgi:uncharacterized alpha-E superfamily protein
MDSLARLLEAAQRMSGFTTDTETDEWKSAIIASGNEDLFFEHHDKAESLSVARFLGCARENSSSILACLDHARVNARGMRTSLTRDMWDAVNEAWLDSRRFTEHDFLPEQMPRTLDWVRQTATRFNGAYLNTMLRNDVYSFTRLGGLIERADNTARILDVKYHVLLPRESGVGGLLDYYQWSSILQAVSAARAYRVVYHDKVNPRNVADLLILRPELPRSLRACYDEIQSCLAQLSDLYGGQRGECHRLAGEVAARLRYGRINAIFTFGLHEFLTEMIERTGDLSDEIARHYLT